LIAEGGRQALSPKAGGGAVHCATGGAGIFLFFNFWRHFYFLGFLSAFFISWIFGGFLINLIIFPAFFNSPQIVGFAHFAR
jgi:hypothetical protein